MPVAAAMLPAEFTWNCDVDPTAKSEDGAAVPMPTLPLVRAVRSVVPPEIIWTLPVDVLPNWSVCLSAVPRMPLPVR